MLLGPPQHMGLHRNGSRMIIASIELPTCASQLRRSARASGSCILHKYVYAQFRYDTHMRPEMLVRGALNKDDPKWRLEAWIVTRLDSKLNQPTRLKPYSITHFALVPSRRVALLPGGGSNTNWQKDRVMSRVRENGSCGPSLTCTNLFRCRRLVIC